MLGVGKKHSGPPGSCPAALEVGEGTACSIFTCIFNTPCRDMVLVVLSIHIEADLHSAHQHHDQAVPNPEERLHCPTQHELRAGIVTKNSTLNVCN